jgi:hypothetical protein
MNNSKSNDNQKKSPKNTYKNHFYIDYSGHSVIFNGKRFRAKNISIVSSEKDKNEDNVTSTSIYKVITDTDVKGTLTLYSSTPNYKAAKRFINKCIKNKKNL